MAAVLDLTHILELVNDRLGNGTTTQKKAVDVAHQARLHSLLALGDQLNTLRIQKLEKRLGDIALVPINLAK